MESDHRTTSPNITPSMEEPIGGIESEVVVRPVKNELEAQEAVRLLADQIPIGFSEKVPSTSVKDDGTLRPTLIGAFRDETLIGAAFIGPGEHIADQASALLFASESRTVIDKATQILRRNIAYMAGIAVLPGYRRQGIGRKIKSFCELWAANNHASLIVGIATTRKAVALNKSLGYTVLPQQVSLMLQCVDVKTREYVNQAPIALTRNTGDGMSRWVFKQLTETRRSPILVGKLMKVGQGGNAFTKHAAEGSDKVIYLGEWSILNANGIITTYTERVQ